MHITLIRHGKTKGNLEKRYVGRTDEPLSKEGIEELRSWILSKNRTTSEERHASGEAADTSTQINLEFQGRPDLLYISPMLRCKQTAEILFPGVPQIEVTKLREIDFGAFEYKTWQELSEDPRYQEWIDSNGSLPFPEGESQELFQKRCCEGFCEAITDAKEKCADSIAFVVHGGTIMSIMAKYALPKKDYFSYQVGNGEGFRLTMDENSPAIELYEESKE